MPDELTSLERAVIALSRNDPAWSVMPQGVLARWVCGRNFRPLPLANPRLEALRRYAILRRIHGSTLAKRERELLYDAGYDPQKIKEVDDLVSPRLSDNVIPLLIKISAHSIIHFYSKMPGSRDIQRSRKRISNILYCNLMARISMKTHHKVLVNTIAIISLLPLAFWHSAVRAQAESQSQAETERRSDGQPQSELPVPPPLTAGGGSDGGPGGPGGGDRFAIGVGGIYQPAYMGAKDYRFQPLPALDIKWGRFFANFQDGIGATIIDSETVTIGAGIVMADNYRAKDVPNGLGKLSFGVGGRGFVTLRQFGFEASAGITQIITGSTGGMLADFSLSRPIMVSERLFLNPSIGTTWANRKHNNRYFGVSEQQSMASGLPQFQVGSGFVNAKAELGLQYRLTDRIGLGLVGGVTTLFGDVKDSPIVQKKTAPYGIGFISYSF